MRTENFLLLSPKTWTARAKAHEALVSPLADAFIKRRGLSIIHPVHDFLFIYYRFSPAKLKQWIPSFEESLEMTTTLQEEFPWLNEYWFKMDGNILSSNTERIHDNIRGLAAFVAELCENILQRTPRFGCFGLHEWAMVYKLSPEELRYKDRPLRLSSEDLARFVESQNLCCSHYDAFRFFTEEARPLNTLKPVLETRLQLEQAGCVHANMDLYKWSIKLWPWIGSDFLAKVFFLAVQARELDMRASPYDLTGDGYLPICIETEEGRKQYQKEQQQLTAQSTELRQELLAFSKRLKRSSSPTHS